MTWPLAVLVVGALWAIRADRCVEAVVASRATSSAKTERYEEALSWITENAPHASAGDGPHDGCTPCFARMVLMVAAAGSSNLAVPERP